MKTKAHGPSRSPGDCRNDVEGGRQAWGGGVQSDLAKALHFSRS